MRFGLIVVCLLAVASCSKPAPSDGGAGASAGAGGRGRGDAAVSVSTARAAEKSMPVEVTTVGTAEPYSTVEIRSQVTGQLLSVHFAEGADVEKDQLLFTIDPRPFEVALRQAEATREKDTATAANAEALRARNENLLKNRLISQQDYDTSVANVAALKGTLSADSAAVDNAKLQLQYTKITAPVSGRTGSLLVYQGSLVRNADTTAMVVIKQLAPIRVAFAVPGQYLGDIRAGQARRPLAVVAKTAGDNPTTSNGEVSFIDNSVDPMTGTIRLKGTFANTDHRLWPGDLLQVTLELSVDPHAIVVPASAVQNGQQGQYVFLVGKDSTVSMQPVTVSRTSGNDAVLDSGIKAGDEVVTDGQLRLVPGARISVKQAGRGAQ
jgi:multidrug efflux system membrane fusion protein